MNAITREDFLARRSTGIGGSDIAALLGLSPYKTPLQLWAEKTGRGSDEPSAEALERMHWGTVLEDVVARHYAEIRGVRVQRINQQLAHPDCEIALANIDRAVIEEGKRARWDDATGHVLGARNVLECKTAHAMAYKSAEWGEPGTEEVPQAYWTQCQWYLGITGLPFADLAVLFGGQRFVTYTIPFERDLFHDMLAEASGWWERHVVADVPPHPSTEDDARRLWRSHVAGREKIVSVTVADAVRQLIETKAEISALEQEEQQLRDIVTCEFGDAESIACMGRRLATWKQNKPSTKIDWKAVRADLGLADDYLSNFTTQTEGARVLRLNTKE